MGSRWPLLILRSVCRQVYKVFIFKQTFPINFLSNNGLTVINDRWNLSSLKSMGQSSRSQKCRYQRHSSSITWEALGVHCIVSKLGRNIGNGQYVTLILGSQHQLGLYILYEHFYIQATLRASSTMHNDIFRKMMASPMKFFDTTPVGRIINRFSADLDESKTIFERICVI